MKKRTNKEPNKSGYRINNKIIATVADFAERNPHKLAPYNAPILLTSGKELPIGEIEDWKFGIENVARAPLAFWTYWKCLEFEPERTQAARRAAGVLVAGGFRNHPNCDSAPLEAAAALVSGGGTYFVDLCRVDPAADETFLARIRTTVIDPNVKFGFAECFADVLDKRIAVMRLLAMNLLADGLEIGALGIDDSFKAGARYGDQTLTDGEIIWGAKFKPRVSEDPVRASFARLALFCTPSIMLAATRAIMIKDSQPTDDVETVAKRTFALGKPGKFYVNFGPDKEQRIPPELEKRALPVLIRGIAQLAYGAKAAGAGGCDTSKN